MCIYTRVYATRLTEVPEYIGNLLALVWKLHSRIFRAQENIVALLRTAYSWTLSPILQRKDLKDENPLAVTERDEAFQKRYDKIEQAARELSRILNENYKLFFDLLPDSVYERNKFELDEGNILDRFLLYSRTSRCARNVRFGNSSESAAYKSLATV